MKTKIKEFKIKVAEIVKYKQQAMNAYKDTAIAKIPALNLSIFTNDKPYSGSLENTIFFTYSNHYRGNSGAWMSINTLNNPHINYEDRGYIKGVATDLTGYLALRAMTVEANINDTFSLYMPHFNKSKHSEIYINECKAIIQDAKYSLNVYANSMNAEINAKLRELTGCSLLHYLRTI